MFKSVYNKEYVPNFGVRFLSASAKLCRVAKVDQYDNKDFNINEAGFIRNDISQLARAQNYQEFQLILSRLTENQSKSLPKNFDKDKVLRDLRPRYCQSDAEIEQYIGYLAENAVNDNNEAYEKALKLDKEPVNNEPVKESVLVNSNSSAE